MQSRSRWYAPDLGRFITPDPNGTGVPVMSSLAMLGTVPTGPPSGSFEWEAHFGDGFDVFGGYGGDPVNGTDPTGLFFGMVDVSAASVIRGGMNAYGAYDTAQTIRGFVNDLQSGISVQQAMLGLAADMVFDKVGGKFFEKALSGAQRVAKAFRRGCNCLTAGAPVLTEQGPKAIESIQVGDRVLSRDQFDPDGPLVWSEVERVFVATTDIVLRITLQNGRSLELTPEHVIWIEEVGWVEARQVVVGDTMRLSDGEERSPIASVRYERKEALTYNIQVAGTRTFFVDGVWVHNDSCRLALPAPRFHRHHIFPQKHRKWFERLGIDIDQFTVKISQGLHQRGVHGRGGFVGPAGTVMPGKWTEKWDEFIENNPNASASDVYRFGGKLMDEYGLSHFELGPY
jgi:hypothetical protein